MKGGVIASFFYLRVRMKCNKEGECHCTEFNQQYCKWYGKAKRPRTRKPLASSKPKKKAYKSTGERALFIEIWNERKRESFLTGEKLPFTFDFRYFAHVLPKGGYPSYRLNKENIVLLLPSEHHAQHSRGKDELMLEDPRWKKFFDLQDRLREEYNQNHK